MAQRSEEIEALVDSVQDLVAAYYADAVKDACEATKDDAPIDRLKTAEQMARSGRYLKLFRAGGRRAVAAIAALPRPGAVSDPEETPMNGRTNWTPERVTELHAEVRRRLEAFGRSAEFKRMADEDAGRNRGDLPVEPAVPGSPPTPPD